jgi:hypothetical protein
VLLINIFLHEERKEREVRSERCFLTANGLYSEQVGQGPIVVVVAECYLTLMNTLLLVIVLLLLFGGGGFYIGGPAIGGGGLGLVLLICLIVFFMGGFSRKA